MLKPLGDRVLIEPGKAEEVTSGGIILPDTAKKKPREGKVLAVGSGRLLENGQRAPLGVAVGDTVIYSEYAGTEVKVGDKEYVLVSEDSLLAIKDGKG